MGLDIVEMILRVEEEFSIEIFDEEASHLSTVGQLHALILDKLGLLRSSGCPSSATFYQLRRALVDLAVAPRDEIRPATPIYALLPVRVRRQMWKNWSEAAHLKLPALERPRWALWLPKLALGAALCAAPLFWFSGWALVYNATALLFCGFVAWWSALQAVHLPANCASVGDVTRATMQMRYGTPTPRVEEPNQDRIWRKLRAIVAEESGAKAEEVTPEADFIRDLRMD